MDSSAFNSIGRFYSFLVFCAVIAIPLAIWKLVELVIAFVRWFSSHWN